MCGFCIRDGRVGSGNLVPLAQDYRSETASGVLHTQKKNAKSTIILQLRYHSRVLTFRALNTA